MLCNLDPLVGIHRWEDPTQVGFIRGLLDNDGANKVAYPNASVPALVGGHNEVHRIV